MNFTTAYKEVKRLLKASGTKAEDSGTTVESKLREKYIDLLVKTILCSMYPDPALAYGSDDKNHRIEGRDWPGVAHSMIGQYRAQNIVELCKRIIHEQIPGDFLEAGVWRGGTCILMRGILEAYGIKDRRVFCADSFEGLPPPDEDKYPQDKGDILHTFQQLAVSLETVQKNFKLYNLFDEQTVFLKGWFKDTMPTISKETFSLIRLDGDMYESTMDVLNNVYDRVPKGGFIVVDDYALPSCKVAIDDFRRQRNILDEIHKIDWTGIWWQKNNG